MGEPHDSPAGAGELGLRDRTQVVVVAYESGLVQPGPGADPD